MRTFLFAALLSLAPPALAQTAPPEEEDATADEAQQDDGTAEEGTDEEGEAAGADAEAPQRGDQVRTRPGDGEAVAPGEVHTVVPGDTLWDLSQQYLGSPWYWPKVWSYNPEIANPHWIYPGNRVRFFPSGEEVPTQVEAGEPMDVAEAPEDLLGDTGEVTAPDLMDTETGVTATGKIGYTPKPDTQRLLLQGFVTARELDEAGTIVGSFSEALMLSYPDNAYIRFKNRGTVQVGGEYVVFKTIKKVEHPRTGQMLGYLTHFLGKVKVTRTDHELVSAQITDTWDEIERGNLIGPANESLLIEVIARPNQRAMTGMVVEMLIPQLTLAGEHHVILIDRGTKDGVELGNSFVVVRHQDLGGSLMDPVGAQDVKWPEETIAACLVVDVKDATSSCLLMRSLREVARGDRVLMRIGENARGASASAR